MASKRRGFLYLLAGAVVVVLRGGDEAARLLARGTDEAVEAAGKGGDEAAKGGDESGSVGDELGNAAKRYIRRESLKSLLEDESASHTFSLSDGYYGGYEIVPRHRTQLTFEFDVLFDESIDAFVVDEESLSEYESTGEINTGDQPLVSYSSSASRTATLSPATTYYLIFDNTEAGLTPASDNVRVDTEVSLAVLD